MKKTSFNWRNVVAIAICSVVMMAFTACETEKDDEIIDKDASISMSNKNDAKQSAFADELSTGQGVTFTAKDDWSATVKGVGSSGGSSVSWLKLTLNGVETYSGDAGTYTLVISVETNYTGAKREATVEIVCGTDRITVTVTQDGKTKGGEEPAKNPVELTNTMINGSNATLAVGIYLVKSNLTLNSGTTLTIAPGAVIRFDKDRGIDVKSNATIIAKGTTSQPITFTSGLQTTAPGDWHGITLRQNGSEFDRCIFEYGAGHNGGMLTITDCLVSITNCTFRNSKFSGVYLDSRNSGFTTFDNNTITNCGENENNAFPIKAWWSLSVGFMNLSGMSGNNTINSEKGIGVGYLPVTTDMTIKKYLYTICSDFSITPPAGSGATITIEPGTTFKMEVNTSISVNERAKIVAEGSSTNPITFTSAKSDGTKGLGDWRTIHLNRSSNCIFNHCIFEYGAGSGGMLTITDCLPSITNCTFRNAKFSGVYLDSRNSGFTTFDKNTITNCGEKENDAFPIKAWWSLSVGFMNLSGMSVNNTINSEKGIGVGPLPVSGNLTLGKYLYTVCGNVSITQTTGSGATLTILPGAKLMFAKNTRLSIGSGGKLVAEGTSSDKIIFTGSAKDRGWWTGIIFDDNNALSGSVLNHCEVSYGGQGTGNGNNANISCYAIRSGVLTVKNCAITHSRAWGIYVHNTGNGTAHPTIENNTYSNNGPGNNSNVGSVVIGTY